MSTNMIVAALTGICVLLLLAGTCWGADWSISLQGGPVASGYNDVRIPNQTGTKISLTDDLDSDVEPYWRLRATGSFGRQTVSALVAPLTIEASGTINKPVSFENTEFPAGVPLQAEYKFNSYRLTWRYAVLVRQSWRLGLGFTGKIRDASVSLSSAETTAEKTNVGFVPLINFLLVCDLSPRLNLTLKGDALAAPQGRAEDVALMLGYRAGDRISISAGYRLLEGGADVDEVYSFALLHYGVVGLTVSF